MRHAFLMIIVSSAYSPGAALADVEDHAAHFRSNLTLSRSNQLIHDQEARAEHDRKRRRGNRVELRTISRDRYDRDGYEIDDADPIHYRSLSSKGLLLNQSAERRDYEEEAHRRQMIRRDDCPLILFFSNDYGGEAADGQMQDVPEYCQGNWNEWVKATTNLDESRLIASESKQVIEREESFNDTDSGKVHIDADGLAWLIEYIPPEDKVEPVTYVIVKPNGMRYTIEEDTSESKVTRTKPRFKRTLLPQYSRPESLAKWRQKVGRGLASETPEYEEAHWDFRRAQRSN